MEATDNRTVDATLALQQENSSLPLIVGQNHLVLAMLTRQQGGVCAWVHTTCCTNVNKSNTMSMPFPSIYECYIKSQYLLVDF